MENFKSVLVTGAAGGLGRAAANELAARGMRVFAADVMETESAENIVPVVMDVTDTASVEAAERKIAELCDGLYAIIHLAGVYTMDSFAEIEEAELDRMLQVNLMGVYRVNKAFLPLVRRGGGRIMIVTSELAPLDPLPFNGIYSMTKTALDSYSHALALELDLIGVKVVTLRPGAYGEGMPNASIKAMERMQATSRMFPDAAKRFKKVMLGEIGTAKDPAAFAAWTANILQKKRPAFEYRANNSVNLWLFSALPTGLQAFLLRLLLKGGKKDK